MRRLRSDTGLVLFLAFSAAIVPAAADTIVLKNGRRITAPAVREEGSRITYDTPDGNYSLPKSLVARIEKDDPVQMPAPRAAAMPPPSLPSNLDADGGQPALPGESADARLALYRGVQLIKDQKYQEARDWLARACLGAPAWPQTWKFQGFAEYFSDRTGDAVRSWRKSLALAPDPEVKEALARAERELAAEAHHEQVSSSHFTLRFEGRQIAPEFRRAILEELERHYGRLEQELGIALREPIAVILYTERAFMDVTQAPSWAAAVNDGRIRVGVEGLTGLSREFSATLMHEMAHSFVWAKTRGHCPYWLDEGLAQLLQGASAKTNVRLARLWTEGKRLPLKSLEGPFNELGPVLASVAYGESLAAVQFLVERHGVTEVVRLLGRLGEGNQIEAALSTVYRLDYPSLEQGITDLLAR